MKRVIKAESIRTLQAQGPAPLELADVGEQARGILADAREAAQRMISEAQDEVVGVLQDAHRRGYQEGLERGRAEGAAEGRLQAEQRAGAQLRSDSAELMAQARKVVDELAAARADLLQQARAELLELAIAIARKIVGRVACEDLQAAQANLAKVLELADEAAEITVKVHPDQLGPLRQQLPDLLETLRVRARVSLAADRRVSPGGVRLVGRHGEIDATIETQMANVVEALLGPPTRDRPGGEGPTGAEDGATQT